MHYRICKLDPNNYRGAPIDDLIIYRRTGYRGKNLLLCWCIKKTTSGLKKVQTGRWTYI
ncbi:uncharacterized protein PgNI_12291 [Pyricularia grisea]|uniref:Uncharacterized protein n=1 Tax=Pyricularia grisea TaxID=148305 RepID=A0A6P8AN23_PYRGI|nr:uncharacterized protein PgNI_12291 [Pyricularia grisea]TLD03424.1 hypothetical protein PgNI_12291 [Pyricularia grisea]